MNGNVIIFATSNYRRAFLTIGKRMNAQTFLNIRKPKAIDLFSGCGGLTEGLKQGGMEVIGAIEIDALAAETYTANHPDTTLWQRDIRSVTTNEIMSKLSLSKGSLDLLAGCPPCQGFSSIRTLNGSREVSDPRNDLIFEFTRMAKALRPRVIMLENVPGLEKNHRFTKFCNQLRRLGYHLRYKTLNAARFGVPQRRERLILLASLTRHVSFPEEGEKLTFVEDAIGWLPKAGSSGDPCHDVQERRTARISAMIRAVPKDGGSRKDLGPDYQLTCHQNCDGFADVYGRMSWKEVAPTITSGCFNPSKGRFLHPEEDRAITIREAALLQSFPRNYHFSLRKGKTGAAEMIGNALPPELIRRITCEILKYLQTPNEADEERTPPMRTSPRAISSWSAP
jgi:DNA (cytosine-5)-methyltransferase 1